MKVISMENNEYKERIIDKKIQLYLQIFGSILIEGPKWCGKTWSGRHNANSEFLVSDSKGNFNNRRIAQLNPELALSGNYPRLIDEWQEVPEIWDAVRGNVDQDNQKGKFILTGSATIDKSKYIHSGCGRIARLRMRPMSLYESRHSSGLISLKDVCEGKMRDVFTGDVDLMTLLDFVLVGGWPSLMNSTLENNYYVAREYIKNVLNEDIFKVDDVKRDAHKVELLLKSLARNESTTVTNKKLKEDIKDKDLDDVSIDTITDYLNLFNRLYLTENIPPYSSRLRSSLRVKQCEKRHFVDPSLACALLNLTKEKLINDLEFTGFLFESLVERDLLTYVDAFGAKLYHYQDYDNQEMDAIIELEDGSWCGIEIKLGANQIENAANNLIKINKKILQDGQKGARQLIVICGMTNAAYQRKDGVYVIPITALKD